MPEKIVRNGAIEIWTESFGDPTAAPQLLIMGASAQSIHWPVEFVEALVAQGRYVVRYDNRDTGQSSSVDFATNPYTLDELTADAVAVLDAYGFESAHVAGASMGGMITQLLAIHHPDRLRDAVLIMSSPLAGGEGNDAPTLGAADLPGPDPAWMEAVMALNFTPAETREQQVEQRVKLWSMLAGSAEPFDEVAYREISALEVDRARNFAAMNNHGMAVAATALRDRRPLLAEVSVPTLVIHGTEDPILPYPHGQALAETIPGATLLTLEGAGHEMPAGRMQDVIDAMVGLR